MVVGEKTALEKEYLVPKFTWKIGLLKKVIDEIDVCQNSISVYSQRNPNV